MTSSNKIQSGLVLIIGPIVSFLCYLIGEPYTWSGYNYLYGNISTNRFFTLTITLILLSFFGWVFLYLITKLLKVKIVLWQVLYYWIIVISTSIILLAMYEISGIS
jgi:magnesium-transporting ATPase (P-type)